MGNPRKFAEQLTRKATERLIETSIVPYFRPTLHFMHDSYDKFLHVSTHDNHRRHRVLDTGTEMEARLCDRETNEYIYTT